MLIKAGITYVWHTLRDMMLRILINLKVADVILAAVFLIKEECCCNYYNNNIDRWVGSERSQCYHSLMKKCRKSQRSHNACQGPLNQGTSIYVMCGSLSEVEDIQWAI